MIPDPTAYVEPKRRYGHKQERFERGFSSEDWWNFDTYIAWVITNAIEKFRDDGSTVFSDPGQTFAESEAQTKAEYEIMIKGFGNWVKCSKSIIEESDEVVADLDAALDIFKKRFVQLWD